MTTPALHIVTPLDVLREALATQDEVILSGCAGTGKTWHVQHLLGEGVVLAAPTAKAALRLKQVCNTQTSTVHSIIYGSPRQRWYRNDNTECTGSDGRPPPCGGPSCHCSSRLSFSRGADLENVQLFVVDEASMVGRRLAADIRAAVARLDPVPKILWVGDPAQLPPVGEPPGVDLHAPDVLLEHVYRAQGGILALATAVRHAESFAELAELVRLVGTGMFPDVRAGAGGWSGFATWRRAEPGRMAITHTNRDRVRTNTEVRRLLGRPDELVPRDRVIVRKNQRAAGVFNGEIFAVESVRAVHEFRVVRARLDGIPDAPIIQFVVQHAFLDCATKDDFEREELRMRERIDVLRGSDAAPGPLAGLHLVNVQYGYAITAHAAQGSEAEEVGVAWTPGSHRGRFDDARSWLYTACTRAQKSLTLWSGGL